ncbi:hypothetical protein I6E12_05210 [Prevotella brevis]|uniref:IS982 family transposase n=1 Tax=Xylanibacter brevis TaxID=83231 RepID=A0ABS9CGR1_9BACT|nr:hypothetical protein [Xylanibacter brevis]
MTTDCKVTELFCIIDEFCKHFDAENAGNLLEDNSGVKRRRRAASLSDSEIMTILLYFHFGTFRNFKHYYLFFIKGTMKSYIIETINDMLKNTAQIVHSRHRYVSNFIMNLISALGAYCFFDNKPMALQGYCTEDTKQLTLF